MSPSSPAAMSSPSACRKAARNEARSRSRRPAADGGTRPRPSGGPRRTAAPAILSPATQAATDEGRGLFNSTCTAATAPMARPASSGQALAIPGRSYARTTDGQIFDAIQHGIAGTPMPAQQGKLTDDQIWKIAAYVNGLRGTAIDAPSPGDVAVARRCSGARASAAPATWMDGRGSIVGPGSHQSRLLAQDQFHHRCPDQGTAPRLWPGRGAAASADAAARYGRWCVSPRPTARSMRGVLRNEDSFSLQVMGLDEQLHLLDRSKVKIGRL